MFWFARLGAILMLHAPLAVGLPGPFYQAVDFSFAAVF